jgi:uncharacterized protein
MKRVFIVHGWGGSPKDAWFVWLKKQLKGCRVDIVNLPTPDRPNMKTWVATLAKAVGTPDKNTFFVGHSIGCQTTLRYLAKYPGEIGGIIFVTPWFTLKPLSSADEKRIAKPWLTTQITIHPQHMRKTFAVFSDDDYYVPLENVMTYRHLGAKVAVQKHKGHFSSHEDGIKTIPLVLKELKRMMQ